MGVNLRIGNAELRAVEAEYRHRGRPRYRVGVAEIQRDDAPSFPGAGCSNRTNEMSFSGRPWESLMDALREAGVYDIFFHPKHGLIEEGADYPGVAAFVEADVIDLNMVSRRSGASTTWQSPSSTNPWRTPISRA